MEITGFSYSLSFFSLPLSSSSFLDSTHSLFRDVESRSYEHARGLDEESRTKKKERNENTINKEKSTKQIDVKTSNLFLLVRARIVSRGMHTPSIRGFESSTILESKKKEKKKYRSRQRLSLDASVTIHRDERNSGLNRSISILSKTRPLDLTLLYIEKKNLQKSRMQFRCVFLFAVGARRWERPAFELIVSLYIKFV